MSDQEFVFAFLAGAIRIFAVIVPVFLLLYFASWIEWRRRWTHEKPNAVDWIFGWSGIGWGYYGSAAWRRARKKMRA